MTTSELEILWFLESAELIGLTLRQARIALELCSSFDISVTEMRMDIEMDRGNRRNQIKELANDWAPSPN
jgi:DNA-binding MarR family transcriptional regulator